ncbi:hypothetical protein HPB52_016135 [Rhipicephalus sanguineus]|uniref:Uncharacterized protein n=1 Tax=Rhipicephalus sanguineus TaxID=34632 RepID=A0A9D4PEW3_RHISA|nr:hypothetical protein HPB52_016135 [Rhipicephalus sanguineus]
MQFLILLGSFTTHCHALVVSLVTGDVDNGCEPPTDLNISAADSKGIAIPIEADGRLNRCRVCERRKPHAEHGTAVERQVVGAVVPAAGVVPDQIVDKYHSDFTRKPSGNTGCGLYRVSDSVTMVLSDVEDCVGIPRPLLRDRSNPMEDFTDSEFLAALPFHEEQREKLIECLPLEESCSDRATLFHR